MNDSFIDPSNLKNLARQISINALITLLWYDLRHPDRRHRPLRRFDPRAVFRLMASMITKGTNPELAILCAFLTSTVGILLGAVNGVIISYGKRSLLSLQRSLQ